MVCKRVDVETSHSSDKGQMVAKPATVGINAALPGVSEVFKTVRPRAARGITSHSLVNLIIVSVISKTDF